MDFFEYPGTYLKIRTYLKMVGYGKGLAFDYLLAAKHYHVFYMDLQWSLVPRDPQSRRICDAVFDYRKFKKYRTRANTARGLY